MESNNNIGARSSSNAHVDGLQGQAAEILHKSYLPGIVPATNSGVSLEYRRREEMAKSCLMEMKVASQLSGVFVATPLFGFRTQATISKVPPQVSKSRRKAAPYFANVAPLISQ